MALVVQKYGGSSVADADGIKRVAQRIVDTKQGRPRRRRGRLRDGRHHRRAASTSPSRSARCRRPASSTCCSPPASGSRWRCSRWRSPTSGHEARSFTGTQAGVITDASHGKARIIDVTPGRIRERARRRRDRDRRRLPGRSPGHQGHHHARPRRLRHHGGRAGRGARRRGLRDLHRRRRRLHRRPADRADRPADPADLLRGDAGDGGVRREGPAPALRGVRPPLRHADPRPVVVQQPDRHLGRATTASDRRRSQAWSRRSSPASRTTAARPRSPSSGVPDKRRRGRAIFQAIADAEINIDMIVQNVSAAATGLHRHLVHAAARRRRRRRWRRCDAAAAARSASSRCSTTTRSARSRWSAPGMRSHPGVTATFFAALAEAGVNIEMISTSEIRISVVVRRGRRRRGGDRRAPGVRPRRRARSRPSSTEGPGDEPARQRKPTLAVVGATGAVGTVMLDLLSTRDGRLGRDPAGRLAALGRPAAAACAARRSRSRRWPPRSSTASTSRCSTCPTRSPRSGRRSRRRAARSSSTTPARSGWTPTCRSSSPRSTRTQVAQPAQGHHRQPQLHDAVDDRRARRAAPRVRR